MIIFKNSFLLFELWPIYKENKGEDLPAVINYKRNLFRNVLRKSVFCINLSELTISTT